MDFDLSDLVDEAVARSGGEASTAADVLNIRRSLRLLTERWTAQGYNTWRITTQKFNYPGGEAGVLRLPDCVDDIVICAVSQSPDLLNRSPIRRISAAEFAALNRDDTIGRPSQFWLQRTVPPILHLYPTSAAEITLTYVERPEKYSRFADDSTDIPGRWLEAMTMGLALDLARKRPPFDENLIARLKSEAAEAEAIAQAADRDRTRFRYKISR